MLHSERDAVDCSRKQRAGKKKLVPVVPSFPVCLSGSLSAFPSLSVLISKKKVQASLVVLSFGCILDSPRELKY